MQKAQYLELKEEMDRYAKECQESFPLKKEDAVEYEIKEGQWSTGWVEYIWFDDKKGEAYAKVKNKDSRAWVGLSDRSSFYADDVGKTIKKLENRLTGDDFDAVHSEINDLENNTEISRGDYDVQMRALKTKLSDIQKQCVHKWYKGGFVKEQRTTFGGMHDVHEYTCEICGLERTD